MAAAAGSHEGGVVLEDGRMLGACGWRMSPDERNRREQTLAMVRVLVSTILIGAALLAPLTTIPVALERFALGAYACVALVVFAVLKYKNRRPQAIRLFVHTLDVCVGASLLHYGHGALAFSVLTLALLSGAHRWGLRGALATAAASMALLVVPAAVLTVRSDAWVIAAFGGATLTAALENCICALLGGIAIGYVAESGDQLRSETEVVSGLTSQAEVRLGLKHTMAVVFDALIRRFDARLAIVVVHDLSRDRAFLWRGGRLSGDDADALHVSGLPLQSLSTYLFRPEAAAWSARRKKRASATFDWMALDANGAPTPGDTALPEQFLATVGPVSHVMGFAIERDDEWTGRLFLIDPCARGNPRNLLTLGQRIIRHITPALDNVYLLHRTRTRSAAIERARIGRELHDGIIQAVMGVQIQLRALAPRIGNRSKPLGDELEGLATILHNEVLNVRDLMQQLQPTYLAPERLIETLADIVYRFQYETGITARFITDFDKVDLPPLACREVTRVVQEALVNVRKHSGARTVFVRFTVDDGVCRLSIDDDGRGFPFAGRLSKADHEWAHMGPRVIKERIRLLGGEIAVESAPNQGSRLDISIPLGNRYAFTG
jgi:signal transduction histidine kinase